MGKTYQLLLSKQLELNKLLRELGGGAPFAGSTASPGLSSRIIQIWCHCGEHKCSRFNTLRGPSTVTIQPFRHYSSLLLSPSAFSQCFYLLSGCQFPSLFFGPSMAYTNNKWLFSHFPTSNLHILYQMLQVASSQVAEHWTMCKPGFKSWFSHKAAGKLLTIDVAYKVCFAKTCATTMPL